MLSTLQSSVVCCDCSHCSHRSTLITRGCRASHPSSAACKSAGQISSSGSDSSSTRSNTDMPVSKPPYAEEDSLITPYPAMPDPCSLPQFREKLDVSQYEHDKRDEAKRMEQLMHAMAARTSKNTACALVASHTTRTQSAAPSSHAIALITLCAYILLSQLTTSRCMRAIWPTSDSSCKHSNSQTTQHTRTVSLCRVCCTIATPFALLLIVDSGTALLLCWCRCQVARAAVREAGGSTEVH